MRKLMTLALLSVVTTTIWAQDIYTPVLQQIEQNSTTLQALTSQLDATKLANKTGLTPDNPEVEFGYLWGNPSLIGNRKDVSVSQSFDFPSAYVHRGKLSNLQNNSAEYEYRTQRMEVLLTAKTLCIELVYYNALREMFVRQVENANRIADAHEKMMKEGETNQLAYNKAVLNRTNMANELLRIDLEREHLLSQIVALNGGQPISFGACSFDAVALPADFESWYQSAEAENPSLQYLRSQVEVANRQIKLSQAEGLPKFSVGYMGEFVGGEKFQGLTLGMSIPLWQNKNKVKQARAAATASNRVVEDAKVQYYNHLKALYAEAVGLNSTAKQYTDALQKAGSEDLLLKAYNGGELSLLEYLLEMEYYYTCYEKRLSAERDLALAMANLTAYKL